MEFKRHLKEAKLDDLAEAVRNAHAREIAVRKDMEAARATYRALERQYTEAGALLDDAKARLWRFLEERTK